MVEAAHSLHGQELGPGSREFPDVNSGGNWIIVAAIESGRTIGYVSAEILVIYDSEWFLKWLLVDSEHRRQGVGTALLGAVATAALRDRSPALLLEPLHEAEGDLERYYMDRGFRWVEDPENVPSRYLAGPPTDVVEACGEITCLDPSSTST